MMTPAQRMQSCADLIGERGVPDPWDYARRMKSTHEIGDFLAVFDAYLMACGVRHFTALEVCTPSKDSQKVAKRTDAAESLYRDQFVLVPEVWLWQPIAALVVGFCDPIREALGAPVTLRNCLRPWWINQQVAGSGIASDHCQTASADLDLSTSGDLKAAHAKARELYDQHGENLAVSMGQGETVIHMAIHSPLGHRKWNY